MLRHHKSMSNHRNAFGTNTSKIVATILGTRELIDWHKPLNLRQRLEMLLKADASDAVIDQVMARWHGHNGPVDEFDFEDTTAVEIPEDIFAQVRA